ncbi:hypothetical protein SUGI_0424840 [Cryptomeria japonica]|nr:hypothetical protein SUGI_0424840 [Cryptomeria japonica]
MIAIWRHWIVPESRHTEDYDEFRVSTAILSSARVREAGEHNECHSFPVSVPLKIRTVYLMTFHGKCGQILCAEMQGLDNIRRRERTIIMIGVLIPVFFELSIQSGKPQLPEGMVLCNRAGS